MLIALIRCASPPHLIPEARPGRAHGGPAVPVLGNVAKARAALGQQLGWCFGAGRFGARARKRKVECVIDEGGGAPEQPAGRPAAGERVQR